MSDWFDGHADGERDGACRQREEDAALVRTAGCQCDRLGGAVWELPSGRTTTSPGPKRDRPVKIHNRACPVALAAEILEGR